MSAAAAVRPHPAVGRRLARALLALAGKGSRIAAMHMRPWASATFVGARHEVELVLGDDAAVERLCDLIADCDIPIRGHFVADAAATRVPDRPLEVRLSLLTIEEA